MTKPIHVEATIEERGINIIVNGCVLPIVYPSRVWQAYPQQLKEVLRDNIALSSTYFVPQILGKNYIAYNTSRPISEAFLFKNGIYDMPNSALTDGVSSLSYIKKFINTGDHEYN